MKQTAPWEAVGAIATEVAQCSQVTGCPVAFLDFEFNRSQEPVLNLVCCTIIASAGQGILPPYEPQEYWLHGQYMKRYFKRDQLAGDLQALKEAGTILVAYAAPAEARGLQALGIDPHLFTWVDLFADWRQLTFNNYACQYGTYYTGGYERHSVPPHFDPKRNKGKDNKEVGLGLAACVGQMFKFCIDTQHKNEMRDLILSDPTQFADKDAVQIVEYCTSDVLPLPFIFMEQHRRLITATKMHSWEALQARKARGQFMVSVAKMETVGFPLDVPAALNLRRNFEEARHTIIADLVENHYPFFIRKKAPGIKSVGILGDWVEKYDQFVQFLETKHPELIRKWPRTIDQKTKKPTDTLARDEKTLEQFDGIPEIYALRQAKKIIGQLRWFKVPDEAKKKKEGDFFDSVGSDGRLRTFLGAYGTQTSRNAPKASRFVLAMSNWLRCLIKPPVGHSIVAIDYASQEFAIAAVMSEDKNMVAAYRSGDPYLYFAKKAGAVPQTAEPKKCKSPVLVLLETAQQLEPDLDLGHFFGHGCPANILDTIKADHPAVFKDYHAHIEYERQRNLFKSTTLGLQYGMGAEKLAAKLSADMGETITEKQATRLIELHKKTYPVYWKWLEKITRNYERAGCLILRDGWALLGDNENSLSVRNFPVQGTGAVIMREAVRLLHERGVQILAPLHDALYCICRDEDLEKLQEVQAECMLQAVCTIIGDLLEIRLDVDVHAHTDTWVEGKGKKFYKILSKYLEEMETPADVVDRLKQSIYKYEVIQ